MSSNIQNTFLIIIPAFNEESCIEKVVRAWIKLVNNHRGSKILVINDGSKDKTGPILDKLEKEFKNLNVIHKTNEGHGATIIRGYKEAAKTQHLWTFQTDSDDQLNPADFDKLWKSRHKSNFILGKRTKRDDPFHRLLITKINLLLIMILFYSYIDDANVPYRLIKTDYLRKLLRVLPMDIFAPNIMMSILALKDGENLLNIPISHMRRKTGRASITKWNLIIASLKTAKDLILFRLRLSRMLKYISN